MAFPDSIFSIGNIQLLLFLGSGIQIGLPAPDWEISGSLGDGAQRG